MVDKSWVLVGARVVAFDTESKTEKPATILLRYLKRPSHPPFKPGILLDDHVDVRFEHSGRESKGHLVSDIRPLE
jgi:hypothetical protein